MRTLGFTMVLLALFAAGCGGDRAGSSDDTGPSETTSDLSGRITADGSSTVGPYATAAAERFRTGNPDVQVTVGVSRHRRGLRALLRRRDRPLERVPCDQGRRAAAVR